MKATKHPAKFKAASGKTYRYPKRHWRVRYMDYQGYEREVTYWSAHASSVMNVVRKKIDFKALVDCTPV